MVNVILEVAKKEVTSFFRQSRAYFMIGVLLIFSYLSINEIQKTLSSSGFTATALTGALDVFLLLATVFPTNLTGSMALMAFSVERDQKTLEHLLSLPLTDNEIFLGKLLSAVLTGLAGLALVVSVVIGATVLGNNIVWNAPLFNGSLCMLVFVVCPLLVVLFALIATVLARYLSSRESYIINLASIGGVLCIFALKSTINIDAFTFNTILAAILAAAIAGAYLLGVGKFNREKLMARL